MVQCRSHNTAFTFSGLNLRRLAADAAAKGAIHLRVGTGRGSSGSFGIHSGLSPYSKRLQWQLLFPEYVRHGNLLPLRFSGSKRILLLFLLKKNALL